VTEHSLEASAIEQLQTTSVADYIVQRIADEGVAHCFGIRSDGVCQLNPEMVRMVVAKVSA
jgi:hypothetical protein